MTSTQPTFPWRGYVNQLTYGADLRRRVDDSLVTRIADALIGQRFFTHPIEDYYHAAIASLDSGERVTLDENHSQEVVRDLLERLIRDLDERRPWPEPAFARLDVSEWKNMRDTPVIGRISLSERDIQSMIHRVFSEISSDGTGGRVLIVRLRTGQVVALFSPTSFTAPGVALLSRGDPASTIAAFGELTGIQVE